MAVVLGVVVYQEWRRPLRPPRSWTRRRTTVAILVVVPVSVVTLGTFALIAQKETWPNPVVGRIGLVLVVATLARLVVNVRRRTG